jgi:hypothetical protein
LKRGVAANGAIGLLAFVALYADAATAQVLPPVGANASPIARPTAAAQSGAPTAAPTPSHPGGGGYYFTAAQGASEPHVTFHYNSLYACQDWQGGACYLGRRSYLGPLTVCRGAKGDRGGSCGWDPGPLASMWSYLWMPKAGGAYKVVAASHRECTRALSAARHRGHPSDRALSSLGPGTFSSRCIYEGDASE